MAELGPSPLAEGGRQMHLTQARAAIHAALTPITGSDRVPLSQALGRVLAADLVSPIDVPGHDNSAMDGYAFSGTDLLADATTTLTVNGAVRAGQRWVDPVPTGGCVRIMTGAAMPTGLDTVVPLELCQTGDDGQIRIEAGVVRAGDNRRERGEDLAVGQPALLAGQWLRPADLGLAASLGVGQLTVMRPLQVAVFSTGDELRTLGQPLDAGCIYDSNRYSLMGALQRLGMEVVDLGVVADDPVALQATMQQATACADVVLTSGGVSAGDADHTRQVLAGLGEVAFWNVAMRPGRPFAFGTLRRPDGQPPAWLFALPGNPVAALVTFYALVRDALLRLAGATPLPLPTLQARCTTALRKRPGRTEFQRAIVERSDSAGWQVRITGPQGAGMLHSMSQANALIVLHHEQASVPAGELVDVWLFDGLV